MRFRVGAALINRDNWPDDVAGLWAVRTSAPCDVRDREYPLELGVSKHIRAMPLLWLAVEDDAGPNSLRGTIEQNAIALLSNYNHQHSLIDPPSADWLGFSAKNPTIGRSGLWNIEHADARHDPAFLDALERHVQV